MESFSASLGHGAYSKLDVFDTFDVVVLGGGPAGIAASTTAAEKGHRTLLIERLGFCGGAAVSGMSGTICGLYNAVENPEAAQPQQVIFGFAERMRRALDAEGGLTSPQIYGKTWVATHDCATYKKVSTDLLRSVGVNILYHTEMVDVLTEDNAVNGLILHTRSGFCKVTGRRFIDCSGDADIIFRSGLTTTKGNNGVIQNPSMMFKAGNVDVAAYLGYWGNDTISPPKVVDKLERRDELIRKKVWLFPTVNPGEILVNGTKITGFDGRALDVTNPVDHSEAEQFSIYQAKEFFKFLKEEIPGFENAYFIDYAQEVGVRQTRTISGIDTLINDDVITAKKRKDSIARSSWPIELHYGSKPKTEWLIDDYYDVPFGSLVPSDGQNVIVAGRCLSAEHEALASCRVTAQCFEYGRAAALATDLSLRSRVDYNEIDGVEISALMNIDYYGKKRSIF